LREHSAAADRHQALTREVLGDSIFDDKFGASHLHWRKKFAVRKLWQALCLTTDAGELFDVVVPRREVLLPNRPVRGDSIMQIGFEIQIAPAIRLASPDDGTPANLAAANPEKRLLWIGDVRILLIVDEEFAVQFVQAAAGPLDGLLGIELVAIAHVT